MAACRRGWLIVTCGLTACAPGSASGPTLGNEYERTIPFSVYTCVGVSLLPCALAVMFSVVTLYVWKIYRRRLRYIRTKLDEAGSTIYVTDDDQSHTGNVCHADTGISLCTASLTSRTRKQTYLKELCPKRPQTKMATSQTKTATLKIQIGHKRKRPHDMVTRTATNCFLTALSFACRQIYFFL